MKRPAGMLLAAALGLARAAAGGEDADETIHVQGEAGSAPADLIGFSTTIRAEDFDTRITSLPELLEEAVGVRVRSFGHIGSFATVSIRGSTAEQVNIYIDGVLLNPALGGGVNLADLPLGSIEEIDIYRGFTPVFLESGSIGGAINIRTRRPRRPGTDVSGSLSYGSYGTATGAALASWKGRAADGLISLDGNGTEGDFRFFDDNGTAFEGGDDGFETRRNNRSWSANLLGRAGFDLQGGSRVDLEATVTRRRLGVPGIGAFQSLAARSELTRYLIKTDLTKERFLGRRLILETGAYYSFSSQGFIDRSGDTTGGPSTDTENLIDATGPSVRLTWHPSGHFVRLLAAGRRETARRNDYLNPVSDRGETMRWTWSLAAEDEIHLAGERLIVSPSARWERFSSSFHGVADLQQPPASTESDAQLTGRIGAAWRLLPTLTLKGTAGRFHRVPSFTEIFGDQGTVKGSGDLRPEEGNNFDLGVAWESAGSRAGRLGAVDRLFVEASWFRNDADNLIQFVQTSQSQVTASNTGRARVTGAEISCGLGLLERFSGSLNYTYLVPEDLSGTFRQGSDLPGRPRHEASASATLGRITGAWGRASYQFTYVGPNFFDPAAAVIEQADHHISRDQIRAPGRYLHDLGYTRAAGPLLEFTLEMDNIFDVKTVDVARFPLPGRLVEAKLRVKLP